MQRLKILGVDPGTRHVGFGLLECQKKHSLLARDYAINDAGVLKANTRLSTIDRVGALHISLLKLVKEWQPNLCVIESAFFGLNAQSSLKLGLARGALIAALAHDKVKVVEIAPTKVKKCMTGSGHADKAEVAVSLERLLGFQKGNLSFDATDALAIALSYCLENSMQLPWKN